MNEDATRIRIVKSKCMADMLVWLGFEYKKTDEGHIFQRSSKFDLAWKDVHVKYMSFVRLFIFKP